MPTRRVHRRRAGPLRLLTLLFTLGGLTPAHGTDEHWLRALTVDDGLSQNFVTAIVQDRDGYLWFGTLGGLNRWDGHDFAIFTSSPDVPASLTDSAVLTLHVDRSGRLWVGTAGGLDHYDPALNAFQRHGDRFRRPGMRSPLRVELITSDRGGRVWFASLASSRLGRLDPLTGAAEECVLPVSSPFSIWALHVDRSDRLWVGVQGERGSEAGGRGYGVLAFADCGEIRDAALPPPRLSVELDDAGGRVVAIAEDDAGRLWFGRHGGGVVRYDPRSGTEVRLAADPANPQALAHGIVRNLARGPSGEMWVLTYPEERGGSEPRERLHRVDPERVLARRQTLRQEPPTAGGDAVLQGLAFDHSGVLWLGSNAGGLRHADVSSGRFALHRPGVPGTPGLDNSHVRAVCLSRDGLLWVGTPQGLNRVDRSRPETRYASTASADGQLLPSPANVQALCEDRRGHLWIGTAEGLAVWDRHSAAPRWHRADPARPGSLSDDFVQVIHEDAAGRIWIGTLGRGLDQFDPQTGTFTNYPGKPGDPAALPSGTVHALHSGRQNRLWIGTAAGLAVLDLAAEPGPRVSADFPALEGVSVLSLCDDATTPEVLWIGTAQRGLVRLEPATGRIRFFTRRNGGLPDDTVYGILADRRGRLWLSTNHGLACFDPAHETVRTYGVENGLQSREFNARASFQAADGEMFFGGVGGLNSFHPEQLTDNPHAPRVLIAAVTAMDRGAKRPDAAASLIHRHGRPEPPRAPEIEYRHRDLSFDFLALHYSAAARNRCEYRLDGYDPDWQGPTAERRARYTNLDPGSYTFRVRAISSHAVRSAGEATFSFVILPPFYATGGFRLAAGLGLAAALLGGHYWRTRLLRRRQQELEQLVARRTEDLRQALEAVEGQAKKLQELDAAKSKFFANLSHEFRTPLMLTLGPLRDVQSGFHGLVPPKALAAVELAVRNAGRQLALVDQLLLLARLDAGQLEFRPREQRLDEFLRRVAAPYEALAGHQQIRFSLDLPDLPVPGRFDADQLEQVMGNLLGNAFKFTPAGGSVTLRLTTAPDGWVLVQVEDSGPGIPVEDLPHIFQRFYRGGQAAGQRPGAGIGLAVARECVEQHGGRIDAENRPEGGARVSFRFPAGAAAAPPGSAPGAGPASRPAGDLDRPPASPPRPPGPPPA